MATDYAEIEREFISSLADDTGKTLPEWMAAISASGLTDRNDVIDWLRHQGFQFSRASWMERIHHNGGRPIYLDRDAPTAPPIRRPPPAAATSGAGVAPNPPGPRTEGDSLAGALAAAKGLRPLADLVVSELAATALNVRLEVRAPLIIAARARPFAALWPQPKMLRLYADFEPGAAPDVRAAEPVNKTPAPFPRMLLLDDARRIDRAFRAGLQQAVARAGA